MAFDIKKFLVEDLGMEDAEATATAAKIKPEKVTALEQSRGIYSQNLTASRDLEQARVQLQEASDRLNNEMAEWATLTTREKEEATELRMLRSSRPGSERSNSKVGSRRWPSRQEWIRRQPWRARP